MSDLTVIILTRDEALHLPRAIRSLRGIAGRIVVVDSGSTDDTRSIARRLGAEVWQRPWRNYADQFNWALARLGPNADWVLRLDADEVLTPDLANEIASRLPQLPDSIKGVYLRRRMCFLRKPMRWGGLFPVHLLRLFRADAGRCENRWMDEHIRLTGETVTFEAELIDDNLNGLTWWTTKHNSYASREVVDLLNLKYRFLPFETVGALASGQQAGVKRWIKEHIYARLPTGLRAGAYFAYRYILRLGFLDGREGAAFHILQGFWYRFLVDAKLQEIETRMARDGLTPEGAIKLVLGIDVSPAPTNEVEAQAA